MRRVYQITGLSLLLVALGLGYTALGLAYYTPLGPGPGFFPRWLSGLLLALSLIVLVRATFWPMEPVPAGFFADARGYARLAVVLAALAAVALAMPTVGFSLTMLAFYLVLLTALGRRHPLETVVLALLGSFGVDYVFSRLLSVPLPVGLVGF